MEGRQIYAFDYEATLCEHLRTIQGLVQVSLHQLESLRLHGHQQPGERMAVSGLAPKTK